MNEQNRNMQEILGFDPVSGEQLDTLEARKNIPETPKAVKREVIEAAFQQQFGKEAICQPHRLFTSRSDGDVERAFWTHVPTPNSFFFRRVAWARFWEPSVVFEIEPHGGLNHGENIVIRLGEYPIFGWGKEAQDHKEFHLQFNPAGNIREIIFRDDSSDFVWQDSEKSKEVFRPQPREPKNPDPTIIFRIEPRSDGILILNRFKASELSDSISFPSHIHIEQLIESIFDPEILKDPLNASPDLDRWQLRPPDQVLGIEWQWGTEQRPVRNKTK